VNKKSGPKTKIKKKLHKKNRSSQAVLLFSLIYHWPPLMQGTDQNKNHPPIKAG
jgi:hypothetical protein